jgi:hypothetical protein
LEELEGAEEEKLIKQIDGGDIEPKSPKYNHQSNEIQLSNMNKIVKISNVMNNRKTR